MNITINGNTFVAEMVENQATYELKTLLENADIIVNLHDYGGFERVGSLPKSFTTSDENINAVTGDIVLYQGNQIVFMLGSNSWSYTPLGHINADRVTLEAFFGQGSSTAILSLSSSAAIEDISVDDNVSVEYYNLQGHKITGEPNRLVIKKKGNKIEKIFKK